MIALWNTLVVRVRRKFALAALSWALLLAVAGVTVSDLRAGAEGMGVLVDVMMLTACAVNACADTMCWLRWRAERWRS